MQKPRRVGKLDIEGTAATTAGPSECGRLGLSRLIPQLILLETDALMEIAVKGRCLTSLDGRCALPWLMMHMIRIGGCTAYSQLSLRNPCHATPSVPDLHTRHVFTVQVGVRGDRSLQADMWLPVRNDETIE